MDAAFGLAPAAPAAGTRVFVRRAPAGAGHAANRQIIRCCERMRRQIRKSVDRLDLLTATEKDAMEFGKPDRFVIVVPPGNANA